MEYTFIEENEEAKFITQHVFCALSVLLISFSFLRQNESIDPYGISCLITAFRNSPVLHPDDRIGSYVIDLNMEKDSDVVVYQMIEAIRQSKCNILALSNFIWGDRYISLALPVIKKEFPDLKIMMGGPMVQEIGTASKTRAELELFAQKRVSKINVLDPFFNDLNNRDMTKAHGIQFLNTCKLV